MGPALDVLATDRDFAQLAADAGTHAAYDRYLADDAIVFRPLPVRARDWLATHEPATGRLEWLPAVALSACDDSLAVTLGNWSYTARDSALAQTGQYLTAWRLVDGAWRIVLDQAITSNALPAQAQQDARCSEKALALDRLLAADRKENASTRELPVPGAAGVAVKAVTLGSVAGSDRADLALTHGEIVDRKSARGEQAAVRAVYVRVWRHSGRSWRVLHEFVTPTKQ